MFSEQGERKTFNFQGSQKARHQRKSQQATWKLAQGRVPKLHTNRKPCVYVHIYIYKEKEERAYESLNPPSLHPSAYLVLCENLSAQVAHVLCAKSIFTAKKKQKVSGIGSYGQI